MTRKILGLLAAAALVAGCEFAKKTEWEGPGPTCVSAAGACTKNADCCSYGCGPLNTCVPNTVPGGVCKTTDDCGSDFLTGPMICKSGNCSATATCRDNVDVCDFASECCSHHCTGLGGSCVPNNAPVLQMGAAVQTVPRNQPWTMVNTSYDPDAADTLTYGWTILPAGPGTLSSTTAKNPIFTPGSTLTGYTVTLDVTDNWGLTTSGTVTLQVVNSPPAVTPAVATATTARNVALTVQMAVADANGDSLTCTWSVCRAGTATCLPAPAAPAPFVALPGAPQTVTAAFPTGLPGTDEGDWDVALRCDDGLVATTGTTTVTVTNTPPAIVVPATRTFNLGADAPTTPDASIAASATDANGDGIASWSWTVVSAPVGSTIDTADLGATASTATATFKPDVTGAYTLDVQACDPEARNAPYVDRAGGCATSRVVATVYPYIRPLGHVVTDAGFARGASLARLALVGPDGMTGALWDYDLLAGSAPVKSALDEAPNAVALTPTGDVAVVGSNVNAYKVTLGATPVIAKTSSGSISIQDIIAISATDAYVFPTSTTSPFQRFNLGSVALDPGVRYGSWGAAVAGTTDTYYVAQTAATDLIRYKRQGSSENPEATYASFAGSKLWSSADGLRIFASDGTVYGVDQANPPASTFSPLAVNLGATGLRCVDSSPAASVTVALAVTGTGEVRRYNGSYNYLATDSLPHWGNIGIDRGVEALFAFVSNDGATAYVVLKTTSTPIEYGLYTYALP